MSLCPLEYLISKLKNFVCDNVARSSSGDNAIYIIYLQFCYFSETSLVGWETAKLGTVHW